MPQVDRDAIAQLSLAEKQQLFTRMLVQLLSRAHELGFEVTLGDAYRDPRVHGAQGTRKSYSASSSAHKHRLAIDLNLFKEDVYLTSTEDHRTLGMYWESLGGSWGGRFQDGNHYSLEHRGIK